MTWKLSCFLHFQEIKEFPKNIHHHVVDLWVFGQPPNQHQQMLVIGELFFDLLPVQVCGS